MKKIIKWFKWFFNLPSYVVGYDPASQDYSCMVTAKYYPKTGIYKVIKIEHQEPKT